ncbi:MAG: iron-containing alcohol dehydrogenase [Pseudomonadales bacterium]|nr:iron-containing alcohol dehydrogenase [Pseudomonadales bacterium]
MREAFIPGNVYALNDNGLDGASPRIMIAPPKYIQGEGVLDQIHHYLSLLGCRRFGVLASSRGHNAEAGRVIESIAKSGGESVLAVFEGECSVAEVEKHSRALLDASIDCLIAVGGGKSVDAGKCVAYRVGVPVVIVPTLASNDAPCSALSVMYSDEGVMNGVEFFPENPVFVVVDTSVVAAASARYLVSGMGDAMATWYEARVCAANPKARTVLGTRPTLAAGALGELCAKILYEHGEQASLDVTSGTVSGALEDVVEANTLLSGVGFESGGLAGAHGYAQGFTNVGQVEANFLHGEMVAMGVVAQLMMEGDVTEARRVAEFFARVGLPITLEQMAWPEMTTMG